MSRRGEERGYALRQRRPAYHKIKQKHRRLGIVQQVRSHSSIAHGGRFGSSLDIAVVEAWGTGDVLEEGSLAKLHCLGKVYGQTVVFSTVMSTTKFGLKPDI